MPSSVEWKEGSQEQGALRSPPSCSPPDEAHGPTEGMIDSTGPGSRHPHETVGQMATRWGVAPLGFANSFNAGPSRAPCPRINPRRRPPPDYEKAALAVAWMRAPRSPSKPCNALRQAIVRMRVRPELIRSLVAATHLYDWRTDSRRVVGHSRFLLDAC